MKALLALKAACNQHVLSVLIALVALTPAIYPEITLAAEGSANKDNSALVFEIKDSSKLSATQTATQTENQKSITFEQITTNDPLTIKLKAYLEDHNSPLAEYADEIIQQPQWQRALAVSWVESNFGRFCADNNCSGIGVAPGHPSWRKYPTKLEWFKDMSQLMERPIYKERFTTFEKMRGVYVQPGSASWVYGAKRKYAELMILTTEAQNEKLAMTTIEQESSETLVTFPELAMN